MAEFHCDECGSDSHDSIAHDPGPVPALLLRGNVFLLKECTAYEGSSVVAVVSSVDRAKAYAQERVQENALIWTGWRPPLVLPDPVPPLEWKETSDGYEAPVREWGGQNQVYEGSFFHEFEIEEWEVD